MKKIILYTLLSFNIFSLESSLSYFNLYDSEKYTFNQKEVELKTSNFELSLNKGNYQADLIKLNPECLELQLNTNHYNFKYGNVSTNMNEFYIKDEKIEFSENKFVYYEHKMKGTIKNYEVEYSFFYNDKYNVDIKNNSADLNLKNLSLNRNSIEIVKNKESFFLTHSIIEGDFFLNNVSKLGGINGSMLELGLTSNGSRVIYRDIGILASADIDNNSAYFISSLSNHYLYGKLNLNLNNLEYIKNYKKNYKNLSIEINNSVGIIQDKESVISLKQEYYKDILNLFLIKIKEIDSEEYREFKLKNKYMYYDVLTVKCSKEIGNFSIGITKVVPLLLNFELKDNSISSENSSDLNDKGQKNIENKILDYVLSGVKLEIKYVK